MKKSKDLLFVFMLFVLLLVAPGCIVKDSNQAIIDAARMVDRDAEITASILEEINLQTLSKEDRAKWGVLLSTAYERSGKKITNDSIIAPSLDYYQDRNNIEQLSMSQFLYGNVMLNRGSIKEATENFLSVVSALTPTPQKNDLIRVKAIALHNLASIYFEQEYFSEALTYYQRSANTFDLIGQDESQKIRYMVANTYTRMGNFEKGVELLDSLYNSTTDPEFRLWLKLTILHKALIEDDGIYTIGELVEMYTQIDLDILHSTPVSGEWSASPIFMYNTISALLAFKQGDARKAYDYIERSVKDLGEITNLNVGYYTIASEIARAAGEMDGALSYQRIYTAKKDSLGTLLRDQQIKQIEREYHSKKSSEVELLEMQYHLYISAIVGVALLIGALIAIKLYRARIAFWRREIEEYLTIVESYKQSNNIITQKLQESNLREKTIKGYLSSRKDMMQQVAMTYYTYGDGKKFSEKMRDMALSQEMLTDLIELVDFYTDGAINKLRSEFPQWTKKNYDFAALLIAGFSPQEISVMLSMTLGGVYTLKSKLKSKINDNENGRVREFLVFFD
ncbi:MAG: hypothetical protein R3Y26_08490 [Rikenellaceae bacterium]